jgi:acyl-CoA thioester hydrolase
MIEYNYKTRVRYADIDQMGIVYYSRYYEFFEAARTDMLRDMGLPYSTFEDMGFMMPVIESFCQYKQGATFDREINVKCIIREKPKVKIKIEYEVTDAENGTLFVKGHTVHAFLNKQRKVCRAPEIFIKLL